MNLVQILTFQNPSQKEFGHTKGIKKTHLFMSLECLFFTELVARFVAGVNGHEQITFWNVINLIDYKLA